MTRTEAIKRATELKITLIKLHTPGANTDPCTWQEFFSKFPMRSKKSPEHGLLGFIKVAENKISHYRNVLGIDNSQGGSAHD